ncbi:MAG: CehA/McbA family metallohydrolase [Solirubrobacterales bacterium]|nr:CehA/McbA family metallohydrolase [Solirubrobacterales bacterium]
MGILPASFRVRLSILFAVLVGCFALPAAASAACSLPTPPAVDYVDGGTNQQFEGTFKPELNRKFIQIPFDVTPGITGMRIRYCYDGTSANPGPGGIKNTTLDLGVYEPNTPDPEKWTMNQRRGWSGSAVKMIGIGGNGPTSTAVYNGSNADPNNPYPDRKKYVPGTTTRAYKPGPIPAGKWAVELGAGYIDPALTAGTNWTVEVVTSTDPEWDDEGFTPKPYTPYVAKAAADWYTGDFHAHGENEPGNAPMKDTFDLGFGDSSEGGSSLDFITLVDHNNDVAKSSELGEYRTLYPGKLIIPGTEMTTYDGHFNSHNSSVFTDFRLGDIYRWDDTANPNVLDDGELTHVRGPENPSARFAQIRANGGIAQINHPRIFADFPSACRGCLWGYTDAQTDFSKVSSIEIQTGTAGVPYVGPVAMNPYTTDTLAYYEHALATGNHIAAVGSSDDHKAGGTNGPFDAPVGHAATAVFADELSPDGITDAVNAGHTYVKFYGAQGPDVTMKAGEPGKADLTAIPGDSVTGPSMNLQLHVSKAGPSAFMPGPYTLEVLKDGVSIDSATVAGDEFDHDLNVTESGRYSFKLSTKVGPNPLIVAYSTRVWFMQKDMRVETCETNPDLCPIPSNKFSFGKVKLNKKKGTAKLQVKVPGKGKVILAGSKKVKGQKNKSKKKSKITLTIKAKGKAAKALKKKGKTKIKAKVKFTPTGGKAKVKSKTIKLKRKKSKKHK